MFHCFHRFWTITAPQKNISAVTDTPMRIRPYLPKKATDTNERTAIQEPTVAVEKQHRTHSKGKGDMEI